MRTEQQLKAIFSEHFRGYDVITVKEIYEALASCGETCQPILAGGRVYCALYDLGYGKEGEVFRLKFPRPRPKSALVRLQPSTASRATPTPRTDFPDGEPRIRDTDLGAFLGFERPRAIRELIARHYAALKPTPHGTASVSLVEHRVTPERGGHSVTEFWLTEHQATYIIAKCETPVANEILQKVIAVFVAVRRGALEAPVENDPIILMRRDQLKMRADVDALGARLANLEEAARAVPSLAAPAAATPSTPEEASFTGYLAIWEYNPAIPWRTRGNMGAIARRISRELGVPVGTRPSSKWGKINTYSRDVLDKAWAQLQAA